MAPRVALDPARFVISSLTDKDDVSSFSCGDSDLEADLNAFLRDDAWRLQEQQVTRVYLGRYEGELVGYVAMLTDAVELKSPEKKKLGLAHDDARWIPAVKVGRLAVSASFRDRYRGGGEALMRFAVATTLAVAENVGCRLVTVDAYASAFDFYKKLGFVPNKVKPAQDVSDVAEAPPPVLGKETTSMRLDVRGKLPEWAEIGESLTEEEAP